MHFYIILLSTCCLVSVKKAQSSLPMEKNVISIMDLIFTNSFLLWYYEFQYVRTFLRFYFVSLSNYHINDRSKLRLKNAKCNLLDCSWLISYGFDGCDTVLSQIL